MAPYFQIFSPNSYNANKLENIIYNNPQFKLFAKSFGCK